MSILLHSTTAILIKADLIILTLIRFLSASLIFIVLRLMERCAVSIKIQFAIALDPLG